MKALDLFCGSGGAGYGLKHAGFEVTGVDLVDRDYRAGTFLQAGALGLDLEYIRGFDLVWASPPCQKFSAYRRRKGVAEDAVNLIPQTRKLLDMAGVPYVIENVTGAREELIDPVMLCGSMFGLDVQRHRLFEANGFIIEPMSCDHGRWTPRFPPATNRTNLRKTVEVGVWRIPLDVQVAAMGWPSDVPVERRNLSLAIPPAYAAYIGAHAREQIEHKRSKVC